MKYPLLALAALLLGGFTTADAKTAGRSFEECQALAISLGIHASRTTRVYHKYLRYKAAGTAIRPRGMIARCMAGTN
jgi:hypothetical protein